MKNEDVLLRVGCAVDFCPCGFSVTSFVACLGSAVRVFNAVFGEDPDEILAPTAFHSVDLRVYLSDGTPARTLRRRVCAPAVAIF